MIKIVTRLLGGAALVAMVAVLGRGAATPASADPFAVLTFNPSVCAALEIGTGGFVSSCQVNQFGLRYLASGGDGGLMEAANVLGNNNGVIEPSDFAAVADFTGGQIHQQGGVNPSFSRLAVVAFVHSDAPVTFHASAGTFDASGAQTWICDGTGTNADTDCDGVPSGLPAGNPLAEDHAVVAYLSCTAVTCPSRGTFNLTVEQDGIVFPTTFQVVGEARTVSFLTLETGVQAGVFVNGALNASSAAAACPFGASVAFLTKALGEAEKTVIIARATDIDGTDISGAWFQWSVDDPNHNTTTYFDSQGILSQPVTPTLNLGGFGYGAPNLLCVPAGAAAGDVTVTARLVRTYSGQPFDPNADPGTDPGILGSTKLAHGDTTFTVNAIPAALTLSASPAEVPCDGSATSTVSAALTDAAGNPALSGTAVHFDVLVLGTANPIDTVTNDKGIATSVISPLSGDARGVPVTVSVLVGGVLQPDLTQQILVACSAAAPPPPPAGGDTGSSGGGTTSGGAGGVITGPNTGTGAAASGGASAFGGYAWLLIALVASAGAVSAAGGVLARRRIR